MPTVRRIGWVGLPLTAAVLATGLLLVVGSAVAAGDWWLAGQPWIGIGLSMLVFGLAGTAAVGLLLVVVEPLGWWRLAALPPALLVGGFWAFVLNVGLPTTGGTDFDVPTILYSLPSALMVLLVATVAIALVPVVGSRARTARS